MSVLKVGILLTALTALFVLVGQWIGGTAGAIIALAIAAVMNIGSFWFSDRLVLRMTQARELNPRDAQWLYDMVEELTFRAGIPMPKLYVVEDPSPNAFATGRSPKHAAIAVHSGLLQILNRNEVAGVLAHEIAHIKSRDTLTMSIVATIAGGVMMLANFAQFAMFFGGGDEDSPNPLVLLLVALFAPLAATMVQLGISRAREYEADRIGAEIAGSPVGLMNALQKLELGSELVPSNMPPQAAHLCIVNPFGGSGQALLNLFRTHPRTEDRVRRLRDLLVRVAA